MLFVACDQGETVETTVETTEETTEEITTEAVIEDIEVDYSAIIKDWNDNIEFKKPETSPVLNSSDYSTIISDSYADAVSVRDENGFILVTKTKENTVYNWDGTFYENRSISYYIYKSGIENSICSFSVPAYRIGTDPTYTYEFNFRDGIFEVVKGELKAINQEDPELNAPTEYEYVYTYSYYNHEGKVLKSGLEERDIYTDYTANGDMLVYIADKCYLIRDGEVFYTFNKGQERPLPYVDFEYLDYKYLFENDTVRVFNSNYDLIAKYTDHYYSDRFIQKVLDNGNVYTQYVFYLEDNALNYDFADNYGNKYNVKHVILDVATGKTTELELGFVVEKLITNADNDANITVKNNNQFAEVYKFADGKRSTDCSFLILDNNMTEVKELPKILKNQVAGTRFLNTGKLLIAANDVYENVYCAVDTANNSLELYVDVNDEYTEFVNGFIYNNVLYSADFEVLYDLSKASNYSVFGDSILVVNEDTNEYGNTTYTYSVISANGTVSAPIAKTDRFELRIKYDANTSCYVVTQYGYDGDILNVSLYNCNGQLIGSDLGTTTILGSSDTGVTIKIRYNGNDYYYFFKY